MAATATRALGVPTGACVGLTSSQLGVTFNSNAALEQLKADQPMYAGMDYDPLNDEL